MGGQTAHSFRHEAISGSISVMEGVEPCLGGSASTMDPPSANHGEKCISKVRCQDSGAFSQNLENQPMGQQLHSPADSHRTQENTLTFRGISPTSTIVWSTFIPFLAKTCQTTRKACTGVHGSSEIDHTRLKQMQIGPSISQTSNRRCLLTTFTPQATRHAAAGAVAYARP